MESQAAASHSQPTVVTLARIKAALEQVPVNRLNDVYEYLIALQEDAEDLAAIEAARAEMERTGDRGMPLEDYLRARGLLEEVDRLHHRG